ncbi:MAG: hypothetical protein Rubg2KO_22500 [Rubricoccaceae bacterium]
MSRRYTEEEAQRIFARVAERQRDAARSDHGLSLDDLQEAAQAAGLDPSLVVQAAAALDVPSPARTKTLLGAPVEVVRQRVIPEPVSDDTWAQIVKEARSTFGNVGIAGQIGRLREWTMLSSKGTNQSVSTRIVLEPTPEGTRLTLSGSARDMALGMTMAATIMSGMALLFGTLFAAGVDPELIIPTLIMAGMAVAFGGGTQIGMRLWERSQDHTFSAFLDRAELIIRAADDVPESISSAAASTTARSGQLDLDALEDAPDASSASNAQRLRS